MSGTSPPLPRPGFRAGYVAIVGRPNAGKSTLLNALLGQKLSIVSSLPQTTRHKILGILNAEGHQVCFLDTPGLLDAARDGLQDALMRTSRIAAREDCDAVVLLVEPHLPGPQELEALKGLKRSKAPLLVVVNKADLVPDPERLKAAARAYEEALAPAGLHVISALRKDGVQALLEGIVARLPESPPFFPTDQLSDRWERFFAAELIRERIFELYRQEVPHACAVQIEEFREGGPADVIEGTVFVEREPQKGILIGPRGEAIRKLQEESRMAIEAFLGRKARLELRVKVRRDWRRDPRSLKEFGYIP